MADLPLPGVSAPELAGRLGVSVNTIYRWMDQGMPSDLHLRGMRKHRRFFPDAVADWLASRNRQEQDDE